MVPPGLPTSHTHLLPLLVSLSVVAKLNQLSYSFGTIEVIGIHGCYHEEVIT